MNIAMIDWHSFDSIGGTRIYITNLALSLKEKGDNVVILTSGEILPRYKNLGLSFYTIDNDNYSGAGFMNFTRFCRKMVDKLKIDVIHAHYNHAFIVSKLIKATKNIPYFITFHGPEYTLLELSNIKTHCKEALESANNIFYSSMEVVEDFNNQVDTGIDERYIYVPNAVMMPAPNKRCVYSQKRILLFVGRLSEEKGIYILFEAMKHFRNRQDIELHVVGDGYLNGWCNNFIKQNNMEDTIKMIGEASAEEVAQRMYSSHIVVIPSIRESMPIVILEAMITGKPIVATNAFGIKNAIENMKEGIVVEVNNITQLISGIDTLLNDPVLCEYLSTNAKNRAEKEFLWDTVSDKIRSYYINSFDMPQKSKR